MKNGKDSRDQDREFHSSLVRCAPNLDSDTMQLLIDNPKELRHILTGAMVLNGNKSLGLRLFYPVTVYHISRWDEAIFEAGLEYSTNSLGFSLEDNGPAKTNIFLLSFDIETEYGKILCKIDSMGFRPASFMELISLSAKYPKLQKNVEVVTLQNNHLSACLKYDFSRGKKLLHVYDSGGGMSMEHLSFRFSIGPDRMWRFAAVLK